MQTSLLEVDKQILLDRELINCQIIENFKASILQIVRFQLSWWTRNLKDYQITRLKGLFRR